MAFAEVVGAGCKQLALSATYSHEYAKEMMAVAGVSANSTEGFTAFLEKREPTWQNP